MKVSPCEQTGEEGDSAMRVLGSIAGAGFLPMGSHAGHVCLKHLLMFPKAAVPLTDDFTAHLI